MLLINKHFVFDIVDLYRANPQRLIAFKSPSRSYEREGQKQEETRKRKSTSRKSSTDAPQKKIDLGKNVPKGETFKKIFTTYIFSIIHLVGAHACACTFVRVLFLLCCCCLYFGHITPKMQH